MIPTLAGPLPAPLLLPPWLVLVDGVDHLDDLDLVRALQRALLGHALLGGAGELAQNLAGTDGLGSETWIAYGE